MATAIMVKDATYVANGLALLITQFKEKPRVAVLLTAMLNECQLVENAAWDVLTLRALDNPLTVGVQLDMIGRLVGQAREGNTDAAYLQFLRARVKTNRSDGKVETLIAIMLLLLGQTAAIKFREYVQKAIEIEADNVTISAWVVWNEFLEHAKSSGSSIHFIFSKQLATATLKVNSARGSTFTTVATQRIGSSYTVGIGGGVLAGVFA